MARAFVIVEQLWLRLWRMLNEGEGCDDGCDLPGSARFAARQQAVQVGASTADSAGVSEVTAGTMTTWISIRCPAAVVVPRAARQQQKLTIEEFNEVQAAAANPSKPRRAQQPSTRTTTITSNAYTMALPLPLRWHQRGGRHRHQRGERRVWLRNVATTFA